MCCSVMCSDFVVTCSHGSSAKLNRQANWIWSALTSPPGPSQAKPAVKLAGGGLHCTVQGCGKGSGNAQAKGGVLAANGGGNAQAKGAVLAAYGSGNAHAKGGV